MHILCTHRPQCAKKCAVQVQIVVWQTLCCTLCLCLNQPLIFCLCTCQVFADASRACCQCGSRMQACYHLHCKCYMLSALLAAKACGKSFIHSLLCSSQLVVAAAGGDRLSLHKAISLAGWLKHAAGASSCLSAHKANCCGGCRRSSPELAESHVRALHHMLTRVAACHGHKELPEAANSQAVQQLVQLTGHLLLAIPFEQRQKLCFSFFMVRKLRLETSVDVWIVCQSCLVAITT